MDYCTIFSFLGVVRGLILDRRTKWGRSPLIGSMLLRFRIFAIMFPIWKFLLDEHGLSENYRSILLIRHWKNLHFIKSRFLLRQRAFAQKLWLRLALILTSFLTPKRTLAMELFRKEMSSSTEYRIQLSLSVTVSVEFVLMSNFGTIGASICSFGKFFSNTLAIFSRFFRPPRVPRVFF